MPVVFRPSRAEELPLIQALIVRSINDLTERHGFGPMAGLRAPEFQLFSWKDDRAGFWTAEQDGEIVGSAFSWVCGELWFLAELFISPLLQGRGIGRELLKRALAHADEADAKRRALITFTFNRVSQTLYIRNGLFPRCPIYMMGAARETVARNLTLDGGGELRIEPAAARADELARIDLSALGVSREKHHRFLRSDPASKGYVFYASGNCVGYAYVNGDGHIGPLAAVSPDHAGPVFTAALRLALDSGASRVSAFVPGASERPLQLAVEHGLRITFPMLLMSSDSFGDWRRYLPRNPGFM
jgi:GNAT superfamily N-acetyltransferase